VTKRRDRKAALKFLGKSMKRHGRAEVLVTDKLRTYGAAMKVIGNADRQETGRWLNNRAENSHQPFQVRRRPLFSSQSLQPGARTLQQDQFQAEPSRCSSRVARYRCGIRDSLTVLAETGSHWSDSTATQTSLIPCDRS
jgi:hypothetical protein